LDAGLTRVAVPNPEQLREQLKQTQNHITRLRKRQSNKERQLERMQEQLSEKAQQVAALQVRQQSYDSDIAARTYNSDGLAVWAKDVSFLHESEFVKAYQIGMDSGHKIGRGKGSNVDIHIEWRVHVACWAAWHAKQLPGSFVECGVNTGIFSLAVCNYIDFNSTGKDFFLFDTFEGIPEEQMAEQEKNPERIRLFREAYEECYDIARRNFEPFPKARLIRGRVPDTLGSVDIDEACYLSLDMNIAEPEIAAIEFFWDKLVSGAPVLLDDYGWLGHSLQKEEMDKFASKKGVKILTMPTGQGLLLKP
jgi:hypothetical protein